MKPSQQYKETDETLIWKAFKSGDESAFGQIYQKHIQDLLNYGNKINPDRQQVQDSVQDLFIELWHSRQRLSDTDSIKFYLFRSLRNKLIKFFKGGTLVSLDSGFDTLPDTSVVFSVFDDEIESERIDRLKKAVLKLSPRQQEAINLRYFHDFNNEQVAEMMGVNYQSACKLIYGGLKFLKENVKFFISILLIVS
ncbi:RNA polymerase sigma factor [Dyadobacter sp. CY312]|uniref:RNA polymerase sigma factor n=1 Tax=Dyadobacter sp. CY312 TaxID=2907303 RepID=UPI001F33E1DB|nr:sigma-70 family RNA polymerase sigma factor [Dyadobacter sp. CY312]MCE7041387.1 sigma-70 family RNA polymerase sigma factor [Dyadobacter sp. CY312]